MFNYDSIGRADEFEDFDLKHPEVYQQHQQYDPSTVSKSEVDQFIETLEKSE